MAQHDELLQQLIRDAGMRVTRARVTVMRLLTRTDRPVSHADVTKALSEDGWDRATLYRNLIALTDAGLLRRVDMGDHVWRFERVSEQHEDQEQEHPHFLCTACGEVSCLPELKLQMPAATIPRALSNGQVSIQLRGICDGCFQL